MLDGNGDQAGFPKTDVLSLAPFPGFWLSHHLMTPLVLALRVREGLLAGGFPWQTMLQPVVLTVGEKNKLCTGCGSLGLPLKSHPTQAANESRLFSAPKPYLSESIPEATLGPTQQRFPPSSSGQLSTVSPASLLACPSQGLLECAHVCVTQWSSSEEGSYQDGERRN